MNLSAKQRKLITSLRQKKYRNLHNLFIAEGVKVVEELLDTKFELYQMYCTTNDVFSNYHPEIISEKELQKVSKLTTPNKVLAIFKIPVTKEFAFDGFTLALDELNDPGNLGTIIRLCDWFGIEHLICSKETVDCYNYKVVQSSMGSLARVTIHYLELNKILQECNQKIYISDMVGEDVYKTTLQQNAILVMGNEANGISDSVKQLSNSVISIPRFGEMKKTESLNVATATAILLSEFKRR